jgi:hypothetical protein
LKVVSEHTDGTLRAAIDDLRDATVALGAARDGFGWDEPPRVRLEDQIAALDNVLDELERFYDDLYGLRSELL